ncbi:amidohydrolase family protein [Nonomuraea sp. NBC_00507]|uniref:amidohydrolase family protein n=1 Tax=Nonomuraea sp. NBC_00507 TaxID=2976002 RepID=UPI002E175ABB
MAHPHADLLFSGGPILTMDGARTWASSLAVRDGRVVAIGHDEVKEPAGPRTEVVDLRGRLLLPGFQDAHVHAVMGGGELGQCDLTGTTYPQEYARRIRAYADANPGKEWIIGIAAATPDPADGRIERRPAPGGTLQEGAVALVGTLVPALTTADRPTGLLRAQDLLHSLGIAAWQDAMVAGAEGYPDPSDAHLTAARDGRLTATVVGALWWARGQGTEQIPALLEQRDRLTCGRLRCDTVKIMVDAALADTRVALTYASGERVHTAPDA